MSGIYGLMAEFRTADELLAATREAYGKGYRRMDAYAPFPVEGLPEALGIHGDRVPLITLIGGILGGIGGYVMQYYSAVVSFPINVGGRPYNSWPAFIPPTFEMTVLGAALAAFVGMLALNGLPKPYHPVFNAPRFDLATRDRFFLCIEATDLRFDREDTARFLQRLHPIQVSEVPP